MVCKMTVYDINTGKAIELDDVLTPGDAARLLGVHPKTLERWSREGKIPVAGRTLGGHRRYNREDLLSVFNASA
jgi:excisionase family DNA binding protein